MDYTLIKRLSEKKGIALKKLAESINMTEQGLHAAFKNHTLSVAKLEKIADALQVDIKEFFSDANAVLSEQDTVYAANTLKEKYISVLEENRELHNKILSILKI